MLITFVACGSWDKKAQNTELNNNLKKYKTMSKLNTNTQLLQTIVISRFFKSLKWKLTTRIVCDNCGKVNPKILKRKDGYTRSTECCKYGENQSYGKTWTQKMRFPIKWVGLWSL